MVLKYVSGPVVKRLRRNPLKVESRVRFPAGSPLANEVRWIASDFFVSFSEMDKRIYLMAKAGF